MRLCKYGILRIISAGAMMAALYGHDVVLALFSIWLIIDLPRLD